jgi:hypothetical protein
MAAAGSHNVLRLWTLASLTGLLVVAFLVTNLLVGGGPTATIVDVARSRCVKDGFPTQDMMVTEMSCRAAQACEPAGMGGSQRWA